LQSRHYEELEEQTPETRLAPSSSFLLGLVGVLGSIALGVIVATVMTLPKTWAALVTLALCGGLGVIIWVAVKLPIMPILRGALLASFWFRLEINLLPIIKQGHETPLGLVVALPFLLSLLLLLLWLQARKHRRASVRVFPAVFSGTAAALVVLSGLSVLQASESRLGLYGLWWLMTELLLCFVVAANFRTAAALRQVVVCFAVAILLNSLLGVLQYLDLFSGWELLGATTGDRLMKIPGMEVSRASGLLEAANSFGWALVSFCPVILVPALLAQEALSRWWRGVCVAAFFAGSVALLLTFSRGSWLAFLVALPLLAGVVLLGLPTERRGRMMMGLAGALLILVLCVLPFVPALSARVTGDDEGAAESRWSLMEVAMAMIQDHPLLGVGLSNYEAAMRRYDRTADFITEHFPYPVHNMYLHVAAEAGIPALLCLLTLVAIALFCGWRAWQHTQPEHTLARAMAGGLMIGLIAYLITALKEPSSFDSGQIRNLFLLCGLLIATERATRKQETALTIREPEV
jgi:putative inorganic carbon (hco3(-)) transporter